jgi:hypothetical protein
MRPAMSDPSQPSTPAPTLAMLADQLNELIIEVTVLRESIVTAAEWDNTARMERQRLLDDTLTSVRTWLHILIGVNTLLVLLVIGLLVRGGA